MNAFMSATPVLSIMIGIPMLGALLLAVLPPLRPFARYIGLVFSGATLACALWAVAAFDLTQGNTIQLGEYHEWIPSLGASWALGVNGLGLAMIVLAAFLVPLVLEASLADCDDEDRALFVALVLSLESAMVLIFAARDVFLFYIVFEAMLIPVYFLIGRFGGPARRTAALKFLLYSLAGGLIMLFGVVGLYIYGPGGAGAFLVDNLVGAINADPMMMRLMFASFFIAFAIKAPMVPMHTWLPDTAEQATPGTSILLIGVLDKVGTFGMIMLVLPLFPEQFAWARLVILTLALVSIIYGGLLALGQDNLYRLISYTSISHFGFMVLGIAVGNAVAATGAMVYMVAHGLSIAGLYMVTHFMARRTRTVLISELGGLQRVTPMLAAAFLISGLASIALPGLSGFVPEWMVLTGAFASCVVCGLVAVLGVVIAALYVMLPYQRVFTGAPASAHAHHRDLTWHERGVLIPVIVAMFILGFLPGGLVSLLAPIGDTVDVLSAPQATTVVSAPASEGILK